MVADSGVRPDITWLMGPVWFIYSFHSPAIYYVLSFKLVAAKGFEPSHLSLMKRLPYPV